MGLFHKKDQKVEKVERELNKEAAKAFHRDKKFGKGSQALYIDETAKNFTICGEADFLKGTAEILPLSDIIDCRSDREYTDFYVIITVNRPYNSELRFKVNDLTLRTSAGASGVNFNKNIQAYQNLSDEIVGYIHSHVNLVKNAAEASASLDFQETPQTISYQAPLPDFSILYFTPDPLAGDYDVAFNITGSLTYEIADQKIYDMAMRMDGYSISKSLESDFLRVYMALQEDGYRAEQLLDSHSDARHRIIAAIKGSRVQEAFGIKITDVNLMHFLTKEDQDKLRENKEKHKQLENLAKEPTSNLCEEMIANLANEGFSDIPFSDKPFLFTWFCPNCGTKLENCRFCTNCGTKKPD